MTTTTKAAHTPGPWEYSGGGIWGTSQFNARVRLADITFHNSINRIDGGANGNLMAAAPDLLAVVREYTAPHRIIKADDQLKLIERSLAAIRKAEGFA